MRQEQSRGKTPAARILSLALALCMIAAFVPAFTLTVGAADADSVGALTLFDMSEIESKFTGFEVELDSSRYGLSASGYARLNALNWSDGVWGSGTSPTLTFFSTSAWSYNSSGTQYGADDVWSATFADASSTTGAEKIVIDFKFATRTDKGANYQRWNFVDNNNETFATFWWDDGAGDANAGTDGAVFVDAGDLTSIQGVAFRVTAELNEETTYTVTYSYDSDSDGAYETITTNTVSSIDGIASIQSSIGCWNDEWAGMGLQDLVVTYDLPADTYSVVTVTYLLDGDEFATVSAAYETAESAGADFDAYYYSPGNGSNVLYCGAAQTGVKENITVDLVATSWGNYSAGDTVESDGKQYTIQGSNIVPNGDFSHDLNGWYNRSSYNNTFPLNYSVTTSDTPTDVTRAAVSSGNGGSGYINSFRRYWKIDSGTTYYYSFWIKTGDVYNGLGQVDSIGSESQSIVGGTNTSSVWQQQTGVFTASNEYLVLYQGWASVGVAEVEVYPVEEVTDASATVTVYYQIDGTTVDELTATKTVVKGNTASFDAISNYVYNGKYYSADALSYDDVQEDATYYITLTVDDSKYAPTSDFSYNFTSGAVLYASDTKNGIDFSAEGNEATISIGWNDLRQTIMTFNVSDLMDEGTILSSIVLNMNIGYCNVADYVIAAINPAMVDTETPSMNTTGTYSSYSAISTLLTELSAVTVADGTGSTGWNAITLDLSNANDLIDEDGTLALFIYTDNTTYGQIYTYTVNTDYAPYLSDPATTTAVTYTVNYVDENGDSLGSTTYSTTAANTYGYNNEVICPYVTIPYFKGYIFTSKTVDTSYNTITLTYTSTKQVDADSDFGSNFFDNVDDDTQFVSLNMLGAHDAFTSGISSTLKYDAGGVAQGDSGAKYALYAGKTLSVGSTVANYSKTQDKTALELLEAGVRYFDVRLSRSTADVSNTYLLATNTAPHTNGVFYTTHGVLGEEFRPIAYTIGQWLKEHPGEVISLYFQEAWDDGDATSTTYADIAAILEEAGINDFAPYYYSEGTKLWAVTYGNLTDSGTKAGVVMFARAVGYTQGNFYYGSTSATYSWAGKLYSYYDSDAIPDEFDASYIQTQVDTLDLYNSEDDEKGDHPVYHMARVMQAQTESSNLLSQAGYDNSALYDALISASTDDYNYSEWLTALPIVMVNGVGDNTDDLAQLLQNCNKTQDITITYVDESGTTLATKTKSVVVGSLYTDETIYTIVDNSYDETDGNSVIYSLETLSTAPYYSYNSAVVFTPSYGLTSNVTSTITDTIEIVAAELTDDVYTVRYTTGGTLYTSESGTGTATDTAANPAFSAMNWADSTYDRVGVAILDVPEIEDENLADYTSFILSATKVRDYGSSNAVTFYAMSTDEYSALDIGDSDAFLEALDSAVEVLGFTSTTNTNDTLSEEVELELTNLADYAGGKVVIIGVSANGLYALSGLEITETETNYGVDLYAGAQIRVGSGMDDDEESDTYQELLGDSGLRFIAVVDKTNTMATDASEIGIAIFNGGFGTDEITAASAKASFENTTPVTTITDTTYQDDNETVFTAAIINIDEDNYNRIYVAVPYVVLNGETYYNWEGAVARTPYQVAKGILVDSDTTTGYTQVDSNGDAVDSTTLAEVLNVYTNKTGARVTIAQDGDGYTVTAVTYANGATAFFTVTSDTDDDGNYVFTLTPSGDSAEFYDYAVDYFRINNASADTFEDAVSGASVALTDGNIVITVPAE